MSIQQQLDQVEADIKDAKETLTLSTSLERLYNNRDFKKVILDGYMQKEAVRLVHLKADPGQQSPEDQAAILRQIDSLGMLSAYFRAVEHQGNSATKLIEDREATREEILQEEE